MWESCSRPGYETAKVAKSVWGLFKNSFLCYHFPAKVAKSVWGLFENTPPGILQRIQRIHRKRNIRSRTDPGFPAPGARITVVYTNSLKLYNIISLSSCCLPLVLVFELLDRAGQRLRRNTHTETKALFKVPRWTCCIYTYNYICISIYIYRYFLFI